MGLKSGKLLAIDWDRKELRLVLVRRHGAEAELQKAVSVPLPAEVGLDDAEALGAMLREAMRQSKIGVKHALLAIPREQVVLNTLNLPPTPPEEMPALVQFQIVKELPFSADQATIDFVVCGEHDPKAPCTVLVAAVRHDDLEFYRRVAREAGLTIERIGLRPHANLLAVLGSQSDVADKSLLMVEVGPHLTEINIVRSGGLTFSRAASVPLPDFGAARGGAVQDSRISTIPIQDIEPDDASRDAVSRLMVDVIRSFEAYRATEPAAQIDEIVVCGGTGVEAELAEALAARFAVQARLYLPDRALQLTPQRAKELRGFSVALGLAMGHGSPALRTFDFLHPKKVVSKRTLRLKKAPAAVLAAVLMIGSAVLAHGKWVVPQLDAVKALQAEVQNVEKRKKPIRAFIKKVRAVEGWERSEQVWPEVLAVLTKVFPPETEACVTRFDGDTRSQRKGNVRVSTVSLKLRTAKMGGINHVTESLRSLGWEDVKPGPDSPIGLSSTRAAIYRRETSVKARLPLRSAAAGDEKPAAATTTTSAPADPWGLAP
ncbi:MAG: type IV pilus biogenesis protein PilM [Phycisphaerae bacterium]